jgi:DNA-binding cell septation regulator SpoVG
MTDKVTLVKPYLNLEEYDYLVYFINNARSSLRYYCDNPSMLVLIPSIRNFNVEKMIMIADVILEKDVFMHSFRVTKDIKMVYFSVPVEKHKYLKDILHDVYYGNRKPILQENCPMTIIKFV